MKIIIILFLLISTKLRCEINSSDLIDVIDGNKIIDLKKVREDSPFYPSLVLASSLSRSKNKTPAMLIEELESVLHKKNFSSVIDGKISFRKNKFIVGTVKTFRLWRELLYLSLGRAYYEDGNSKKAILYLRSVPIDSPFAILAKLELGWAYIRDKKLSEIQGLLKQFKNEFYSNISDTLQKEFDLLEAYYNVTIKNYDEAIRIAKKINLDHDEEQANLRIKLLTEAWFGKYLIVLNDLKSVDKVKMLTKITKLSRKVDHKFYDAEFCFLAGEADWHLASHFRIKDPVKYKRIWWKYLERAEQWMRPYVEKSITENKAYVSEEAMFFSIALLWEMSKYKEASIQLVALPKLFPQGEYLEDVYQMLGDYHYDDKRYKQAIHYYSKLTECGSEEKTSYGVYKAAWSYYNLQKKWTALRHLERLYLHYIKDSQDGKKIVKGLFREVREDLLTVMAELMNWKKGIQEVAFFHKREKDIINFKSDLATMYNKIGKYDEAVNIWNNLISRHGKHTDSPKWLVNLGKAYLAAVKKQKIADAFDKYLKQVMGIKRERNVINKLSDEFVRIILIVHKEARKSDDRKDWVTLDRLYKIYEKYFLNSNNGKIWYFGAQRYENLEQYWDAVKWYQKAAMIKEYKNRLDAAHSVLRIASDVNDKLSILQMTNDKRKLSYQKISIISKWYIDHFKTEKTRTLAEFVFVESLYYQNKPKRVEEYLLQRFEDPDEDVQVSWNIFTEHNKRLYRNKNWKLINELINQLFLHKQKLKDDWIVILSKIYQESAFQAGFMLEKEKKINIQNVLSWYSKSALRKDDSFFDKNLSLKSWNNLLLYIMKNKQYEIFIKELDKFKAVGEIQTAESYDNKILLFNIHNMASKVHTVTGEYYKKATDLYSASLFSNDSDQKKSMLWDAALLFASYNDEDSFMRCLNKITENNSMFLKESGRQLVLGRIYYYFKNYKLSWQLLRPYVTKNIDAKSSLLFIDLYAKTNGNNDEIFKDMDTLKIKFMPAWIKIPYFSHLWAFDLRDKYNDLVKGWNKNIERIPASDSDKLEDIVLNVKNELKNLTEVKLKMQQSILSYAPQTSLKVLCSASRITQTTIDRLVEISEKTIKNPQWLKFITRLNEKVVELKQQMGDENKLCNKQKKMFFHYPMKLISKIPCTSSICFKDDIDTDEIMAYEQKTKKNNNIIERVEGYLEIGAFLRAEYLIGEIKDAKKVSFLMGVMRLSQGDITNSAMVLKSLSKQKEYAKKSKRYLNYISLLTK